MILGDVCRSLPADPWLDQRNTQGIPTFTHHATNHSLLCEEESTEGLRRMQPIASSANRDVTKNWICRGVKACALIASSHLLAVPLYFPAPAHAVTDKCPKTAAAALDWGAPTRTDDFRDASSLEAWQVYDAVGHDGNGQRTPSALSVNGGTLTISGDPEGNSGGMALRPGQLYGRWEVCAKSPPASPNYHSVLLLWPDSEIWPSDGEIDFMEILDPARQVVTSSVMRFDHHDPTLNALNFHAKTNVDATQWHSWAVQWTPDGVVGYVDGEQWFETAMDNPESPMHLAMQLDNFGNDVSQGGQLQIDSVRVYA